jgi:hypothetical protein
MLLALSCYACTCLSYCLYEKDLYTSAEMGGDRRTDTGWLIVPKKKLCSWNQKSYELLLNVTAPYQVFPEKENSGTVSP